MMFQVITIKWGFFFIFKFYYLISYSFLPLNMGILLEVQSYFYHYVNFSISYKHPYSNLGVLVGFTAIACWTRVSDRVRG